MLNICFIFFVFQLLGEKYNYPPVRRIGMKYNAVNIIISSTNNFTASFVPLSIVSPSSFQHNSHILIKKLIFMFEYIYIF